MKQSIAILLFLALPGVALATRQEGDVLKYDGKGYYTPVFPLEDCKTISKGTNEFHAKWTSNMRGYVAVWEVRSNKLYLVDNAIHRGIPRTYPQRDDSRLPAVSPRVPRLRVIPSSVPSCCRSQSLSRPSLPPRQPY